MKGLNCVQQGDAISGAWFSFSNPVGVMLDAVRFDQHVSVPVLSWEHSVYLAFFPPSYQPELQWLLSMQLFNSGVVNCEDGRINYSVAGCRASGDMNTAMGNVLIMCAAVYSFVHELGIKARLINNGDDCCIIVEQSDLSLVSARIGEFFTRLGFIIEVEGVARELEHICFCQTHPVYDGNRYVMVRDPTLAISKDVTLLRKWSIKEHAVYLRELGIAGSAAYGNMPVWSSFYGCLSRAVCAGPITEGLRKHVSAPIRDSGLGRLSTGVDNRGETTWQARASFAMAFGLLPATQLALERYYDSMSPGTGELYPGLAMSHLF